MIPSHLPITILMQAIIPSQMVMDHLRPMKGPLIMKIMEMMVKVFLFFINSKIFDSMIF